MVQFLLPLGSAGMFIIALFCSIGHFVGSMRSVASEIGPTMRKANLWMAAAGMLVCLDIVFCKLVVKDENDMFQVESLSLFVSYLVSKMLALGFSPAFDKQYMKLKNVLISLLRVGLCGILLLAVVHADVTPNARVALLTIASAWYVIDTTCVMAYVYYACKIKCKAFDAYYSDDYDKYILWTPLLFSIIQVFGMGWTAILYAPVLVHSLYALLGAAIWLYIFVCYDRHMVYFRFGSSTKEPELIEEEDVEIKDITYPIREVEQISMSEMKDRYAYLIESLSLWIENKGFLQAELTIEDLARQLGTNRTYLSTFINSHYGVPFRQWIASLRIAESKKMLRDTNLREQDIAEAIGFATVQSFIRNFTQFENMSPSAYRKSLSSMAHEKSLCGIDKG